MIWSTVTALGATSAWAQSAPPGTDIYVASLERRGAEVSVGRAQQLTNRPGYDNQPVFTPDGRAVLFTAIGSDGQADIHRVELGTKELTTFIATPESEYSATFVPGGGDVAVIRVEADSTQRLWAFPIGGGPPRLLFDRVRPVGYQAWLDRHRVGLFVLGSPATLRVANLETGDARILMASIGRSLQRVPGRSTLSVTQQIGEKTWYIVEVDPSSGAATPLVRMLPDAEYHVWLPDRSILSAQGTTFYRFRPGVDLAWQSLGPVSPAGLGDISRIAISPKADRIAFVVSEGRQ